MWHPDNFRKLFSSALWVRDLDSVRIRWDETNIPKKIHCCSLFISNRLPNHFHFYPYWLLTFMIPANITVSNYWWKSYGAISHKTNTDKTLAKYTVTSCMIKRWHCSGLNYYSTVAPFTNMVYFYSQHGYVIAPTIMCGTKLRYNRWSLGMDK